MNYPPKNTLLKIYEQLNLPEKLIFIVIMYAPMQWNKI